MPDFGFIMVAPQALSYLYWVLAICALVFVLYKAKDQRGKTIGIAIVVALFGFLPGKALLERYQRDAHAKEAWAYFKKLCDEKSGEKIYKTFTGVKSVVVIKPLPPATEKDLYDQYWYGDPYSNATPWDRRGEQAATRLTGVFKSTMGNQIGFDFVEYPSGDGRTFFKLHTIDTYPYQARSGPDTRLSRFGISWDDISTAQDRKFWVAASLLRVVDLEDQSILAERLGYFIESGFGSESGSRRPWLASRGPNTTCPAIWNGDYEDRWFVLRVLNPSGETKDGK